MAPALQVKSDDLTSVGCSRLSGLLMQSVQTAGPDGVREQGPIGFAGYYAYDIPWVVLVSRSDRFVPSHPSLSQPREADILS